MHIFFPTFYNDTEFLSLQCSLGLFGLLLKYHDPEVALYLRRYKVTCDIYAFNWFITLFASKLPLDLALILWDLIIQEGDWMMIFYVSTAFVMYHRQEILKAEEYILPQTMTNLTLKSKEDVYEVFILAIELRKSTPHSFQYFIINERIFSPLIDSEELESLLLRIEKLPALPLTMSELLFYCFPGNIQCCNPFWKNGLPIKNNSKIPHVTTLTSKEVRSPESGSSTRSIHQQCKVEPFNSFSSCKSVKRAVGQVKSVAIKAGSHKSTDNISRSFDSSTKYKPPKKSPAFGQSADSTIKDQSPKTFDFSSRTDNVTEDWEKCKRRMLLEQKKKNSIPLTEAEKKEINYFKMEMMIFDVRYEELQEHGTLPNWFRFSLKDRLTEEDVDKFIKDYSCCKEAASTICILGAGSLTSNEGELNGVEMFHVKAVNKIISKMERNKFIHITTVEEGFEKCHELCKEYDLRIQEHYPEECYYCMKEDETKNSSRSGGTLKTFAGKFSSLYERMGQRLKNFMFKKSTEFVVENDTDSDSYFETSLPDFDPKMIESESTPLPGFEERKILGSQSKCSDNKFLI